MELPEWLDAELWHEWIAYRREDKNKPASERSQKMTLRKIERLISQGYDGNRLIETAIEREWQGIHAAEECRHEASRRHSQTVRPSAVERVRAANAAPLRIVGAHDGNVYDAVDEPTRGHPYGYVVQGTR